MDLIILMIMYNDWLKSLFDRQFIIEYSYILNKYYNIEYYNSLNKNQC